MAQRDELRRALRGEDARDPRRREDVALGQAARRDRVDHRARRPDARRGHRAPRRQRLGADVDHARLARGASTCESRAAPAISSYARASFSGLATHLARAYRSSGRRSATDAASRGRDGPEGREQLGRRGRRSGSGAASIRAARGTAASTIDAAPSVDPLPGPARTTTPPVGEGERKPALERQLAPERVERAPGRERHVGQRLVDGLEAVHGGARHGHQHGIAGSIPRDARDAVPPLWC